MSVLLLQYGSVSCLTQQRVSLCPFCLELLSCSITSPTRLNAHSTPPALQLACWPITSSVSSLATQTKACANEGGSLKNMQSFAEQMPSHDSLYENSCGQLLLLSCFSSPVCRRPLSITCRRAALTEGRQRSQLNLPLKQEVLRIHLLDPLAKSNQRGHSDQVDLKTYPCTALMFRPRHR